MRVSGIVFLCFAMLFAASMVRAGDNFWKPSSEAGVVTNNDCGHVSDVHGAPTIRRSFMTQSEPGLAAYAADRLNTGDEIEVPADSRLEMTTGNNTILVFGPGTKVRLLGRRAFSGLENEIVTRLDLVVERGVVRCQVRLNSKRPEAVLAGLNGADVLVSRGDIEMFTDAEWQAAALSGSAAARLRRGGVVGAAFVINGGVVVGGDGEKRLSDNDIATIKTRLPFSFEQIRAALPPRPAASSLLEAP